MITASRAEETVNRLREGKPFEVRFRTTFGLTFPRVLGGGQASIDTTGFVVLTPTLTDARIAAQA